jgi:beta propeller repeat protein
MTRLFVSFTIIVFVASMSAEGVRGQSVLEDIGVFAEVRGYNTIPNHGGDAVSFLDFRNTGYSIIVVDAGTGIEQEVARVFYAEPGVTTSGKRVAWIGYTPAGEPNVYVYDRSSGLLQQVTTGADFQNHPDLAPDVLVWQDYRNAGANGPHADVFMHAFASGATSAVTTAAGYKDLPRVSGRWIVWQDFRHSDMLDTADIYVYDIESSVEKRITSDAAYRTHPAVWNDMVVWEDYRNGDRGDIYLYDLSTNQEQVISTYPAHKSHPAVFGDWVVWIDYRNSLEFGDIYGFDLSTRTEHPLVVHPAHQDAPQIHGNHVVWQDYRDGRYDIYGGYLVANTPTSAESAMENPSAEMSAWPNPSSQLVTFHPSLTRDGIVEFAIYDVMGRVVLTRTIGDFALPLTWDGVSGTGLRASPGVYVAVVRSGQAIQRIAFVRQ